MVEEIEIASIRPNPFQTRNNIGSMEELRGLANEIHKNGLWGSLRGRRNNGVVELSWGHRRFQALKLLGKKTVPVDIQPLTDDQMILESLGENFQRKDPSDLERGEAISRMLDYLKKTRGLSGAHAREFVADHLGLTNSYVQTLLKIATLSPVAKAAVHQGKITGRTALMAKNLGGDEIVKAAADQGFSQHQLERVVKGIRKLPPHARQKVRKALAKGKIRSVDDVEKLGGEALQQNKENLRPKEIMEIMEIILKPAAKVTQILEDFMQYRNSFQVNENWPGFNLQMTSLVEKWEKFKTKAAAKRRKEA